MISPTRFSPATIRRLTCVVWAGFDKPQRIYRGAFGSVIALPVWVDVMNASRRALIRRSEFPVPPGLHKVEICSSVRFARDRQVL